MYSPSLLNKPASKNLRRQLRKNSTDAEKKLWSKLRLRQIRGLKFCRQFSIGSYIVDFYCPAHRLAIKLDGGQHGEEENIVYDEERTKYLNKHNIRVIRFQNKDVLKNIEGVLLNILKNLTPPSLPLK